jgi:predicted secreted hydrolase
VKLPGLLLTLLLLAPALCARDRLDNLREPGSAYAQVTPDKRLVFPHDHGAHPGFRIEWWYLTANLKDAQGRDWGLQWTLFRQSLSPDILTTGWSSNQVWMAHAAITTPEGHHHEQRFARGGIGQAGVSEATQSDHFEAWLDDWQWRASGPEPFPANLRFSVNQYKVDLQLESYGPRILNGVDGYSQKSAQGQASYYYSHPYIQVHGTVSRADDATELKGAGWLDREWSSQPLADNQQGWDWFSLHLDDGYKLMVYQLRHSDGPHWLSGSWIAPGGQRQPLEQNDINLQILQTRAVSDSNNNTRQLPLEWRISLPGERRSWTVRALYDRQWMDTQVPYWEGVVRVENEQGQAAGKGYMELTGYP